MSSKPVTSVAFLRGVNVGGHRKIAMNDLKQWLLEAGFSKVATYIQSGNVALEHPAGLDVATAVRRALAEHPDGDVPVVVRTSDEVLRVEASNPYPDADHTRLHVAFLAKAPEEAALSAALERSWQPEEFRVVGRDVYLFLPAGMGRSTMVPRLGIIKGATTRNWNTVLSLADLVRNF